MSGFFAYAAAFAQDPACRLYTTLDGLPTTMIYKVQPDSEGYIWFPSDAGLIRFDSHSFKIYQEKEGIPDNEILEVHPGTQGRIWFTSLNGKVGYIYQGQVFTLDLPEEIRDEKIRSVTSGNDSLIWVTTENRNVFGFSNRKVYYRYNFKTASLICLRPIPPVAYG